MPGTLPSKPSRRVLVLGEDPRILLAIGRSLGRRGIQVDAGWCRQDSFALRSRFITPVPGQEQAHEGEAAIDSLAQQLRSVAYDLVIPITDQAIQALRSRRTELTQACRLAMPSEGALSVVLDKRETARLADELRIPVPTSWTISDPSQLDEIGTLPLPALVKPTSSADGSSEGKRFVRRVDTREELYSHVSFLLRDTDEVVLQERVAGGGVGVNVLAASGKILFAFQHVRLHETLGYGATYRKSAALSKELLAAAEKLIGAMNYTGVAMVEFRVDPTNGTWRLLEINGRFWGSLPLAIASGADFPHYLYSLVVDSQEDFPAGYRIGTHCRSMLGDVRWWWRCLARRNCSALEDVAELGWAIERRPKKQLLRDVTRGVFFRDHVDSFSWDDLGPFWSELSATRRLFYEWDRRRVDRRRRDVATRTVRQPTG